MRLVVDANIVVSLLIRDGFTASIFFDERLELLAPHQLLTEIEENWDLIRQKTSREDVETFFGIVLRNIRIVEVDTPEEFLPDPDDSAYIELARQYGVPLWTHDKVLSQAPVRVITTAALAEMLRNR